MSSPCLFENGQCYFITFRTEHGLPFVPTALINELIWSCIGKAQMLYAVELIGFCWQRNHAHFLLRCIDPEAIPLFIGYIKQETAHVVNRLLGREKRTIWAQGYDKPVLLDYQMFLEKFAYVSLNPWKDQLVKEMQDFKGPSSYKLFKNCITKRETRYYARSSITALKNPHQAWREDSIKLGQLNKSNKKKLEVTFNFYNWKKAFIETSSLTNEKVRGVMLKALTDFMLSQRKYMLNKTSYEDQSKASMLQAYTPTKKGYRMLCLSYFKELRISYLAFYNRQLACARSVLTEWRKGNIEVKYPPGMFPPNLPRLANLYQP